MMTGIVEITRNGAKAARGLVSVQSRLNQVVDDGSTVGQALTEWYQKQNIALYDQDGQLRSLYDVMTDVSKIWGTLTTNEKDYYLNQQAGGLRPFKVNCWKPKPKGMVISNQDHNRGKAQRLSKWLGEVPAIGVRLK